MKYQFVTDCECGQEVQFDCDILQAKTPFLVRYSCQGCQERYESVVSNGKIRRKMPDDIRAIQGAILGVFDIEDPPVTVRHIFYKLAGLGLVSKDDSGYRAVQRQTKNMRLVGSLPYSQIADSSRSFYKPRTYRDVSDALRNMQEFYRKSLWLGSPDYVQIWVEKEAMVSVLHPVTSKYDVQLCVARGYSSMTFIAQTAEAIKESGKMPYIYYFSDFDYDGVYAADFVSQALWDRHGVEVNYHRVCVTEEQINEYNLQVRPPKAKTRKKWGRDYAVDIDTLSPGLVRRLVEDCITGHLPQWEYSRLMAIEAEERNTLKNMVLVQDSWE